MPPTTSQLPNAPIVATPRPRLRGRLHLLAAVVSVLALPLLVRSATIWQAKLAAWVYGISCLLLYAASSTYHVFTRSARARRIMQSVDHSMIYVLIAGTFTPVCLLAMSGTWRWLVLGPVWLAAGVGAVLSLTALDRFRRFVFVLYLVLGWAGLVAIPALIDQPARLVLTFVAGVLYTVGAVLFGLRRPTLSPRWFGYHELWHVFGVAAGALLFVVNFGLIATPVH
jgi:hemolysin III